MRLRVNDDGYGVNVSGIIEIGWLWVNTNHKNLYISSLYRFPSIEKLFTLVYNLDKHGCVRK